jgi:hypothetical protein
MPREFFYVEPERQAGVDLNGIAFGQQNGMGVKGLANLPQGLAEATAGHIFGQVGPEGAG